MATAAEKLEAELRARKKKSDLPLAQMGVLLTHPLLDGLVDRGKGGHADVIRNPYACAPKQAKVIADYFNIPKLEHVIMKRQFPVSNHRGMVLFAYVLEVLDFIEMRRLVKENGLEDLLR